MTSGPGSDIPGPLFVPGSLSGATFVRSWSAPILRSGVQPGPPGSIFALKMSETRLSSRRSTGSSPPSDTVKRPVSDLGFRSRRSPFGCPTEIQNLRKPRLITSMLPFWQQHSCRLHEALGGGPYVAKIGCCRGIGCRNGWSDSCCSDHPGTSRHLLQVTLRQHLRPSALDVRRLGVRRSLSRHPRRLLLEVAQRSRGVLPH